MSSKSSQKGSSNISSISSTPRKDNSNAVAMATSSQATSAAVAARDINAESWGSDGWTDDWADPDSSHGGINGIVKKN